MHYWDTSAVIKLYAHEHDSDYFVALVAEVGQPVFSSAIAGPEVLCALFQKESAGDLKPGAAAALYRRFRSDCTAGRVVLLPYGGDVAAEAERIAKLAFAHKPPVLVRSLDLIHLASASTAKATALVATDKRLRTLASILKLELLPEAR